MSIGIERIRPTWEESEPINGQLIQAAEPKIVESKLLNENGTKSNYYAQAEAFFAKRHAKRANLETANNEETDNHYQ